MRKLILLFLQIGVIGLAAPLLAGGGNKIPAGTSLIELPKGKYTINAIVSDNVCGFMCIRVRDKSSGLEFNATYRPTCNKEGTKKRETSGTLLWDGQEAVLRMCLQ